MLPSLRKRELVQLNPSDLVVLLTLSNTCRTHYWDDNSVSEAAGSDFPAGDKLLWCGIVKAQGSGTDREGKADVLIEAQASARAFEERVDYLPRKLEAARGSRDLARLARWINAFWSQGARFFHRKKRTRMSCGTRNCWTA